MRQIAAALLVLAGLTGCAKNPPGAHIDPSLAVLIPADATALMGFHVDAFEKTPIYQDHLAKRSFPPFDRFMQMTGLKRREDLWELLVISDGKNSVMLGRGKFSDEGEPDLKIPGMTRFSYKNYTLVGNDQMATLLVSPTVMGVGETAGLKALIDQKGSSNGPPKPIADKMTGLPADAALWGVYLGGPMALPVDPSGNLANINKVLRMVQSGTMYIDFRMGISGLITGDCANDKDSIALRDALQALVGLGKLATPKDQPQFPKLFDGLRITQEASKVNVHIDEPETLVDTALNSILGQQH